METNEYVLGGEGSSHEPEVIVKVEQDEDDYSDTFNSMDFLELSTTEQPNDEPIEFSYSEASINPKTGRMICLLCLLEVDTSNLHNHMVEEHRYRRINYKCWNCKSIFNEHKTLQSHSLHCKQEKKKKRTFAQIIKEVDNLLSKEMNLDFVNCPVCFVDIERETIKQHVQLHDTSLKQESVTCDKCKRTFKNKITLKGHIQLVHLSKSETEECDQCGQKFRSRKYLANHRRNVHPKGDPVFQCHICIKNYKSKLTLQQHMKFVHSGKTATFGCHICPKTFQRKVNVRRHLKLSHKILMDPKDVETNDEEGGESEESQE